MKPLTDLVAAVFPSQEAERQLIKLKEDERDSLASVLVNTSSSHASCR